MAHTPADIERQPFASSNHESLEPDSSQRLSVRQILYLTIFQGIGSAILDGGINFGIACGMYRGARNEIRLWQLDKHTIAGDTGLTVLIQGMLTYLIAGLLVRRDIRNGMVEPFGFTFPDMAWWRRGGRIRRWLGNVLEFISPKETLSFRGGFRGFRKSIFLMTVRAFTFSAISFIFWPLLIAIIAPLYGGVDMRGTWIPQVIKGIFGALLGLFTTPLFVALALGLQSQRPEMKKIASTTSMASPDATPEMTEGVRRPVLAHIHA